MKLIYRLTIILALGLISLPSLVLPAVAQDHSLTLQLSPNRGVPGTEITVSYQTVGNFTPGARVQISFSGIPIEEVTLTAQGTFTTKIFVPDIRGGPHPIRAEETTILYAEGQFTVESGLTVTPEEGQVGDTVTVTGRGYGQNETGIRLRYYLNGTFVMVETEEPIAANPEGWWRAEFQIPPSVRGTHRIDTLPTPFEHATFRVGPGIRLSPTSGSPGQTIAVTGGGFVGGERHIKILFDGEELENGIEADNRGQWGESFDVPEMPAGQYTVTAEGHQTRDVPGRTFEIVPGIEISPDEGHVGMDVTGTGRGFAASSNVTVLYEGEEVTAAFTNEQGGFEVVFPVPKSKYGERQVTAEDNEQNRPEQPAIFIMESDEPDTPEPYSPVDGQRVGFARKVRPAFEWKEVFDLSGVYYSLQISTSANVTARGFVEPVLTWEGLSGNYTLTGDEALPHGTYYWIVQAVDGAQNESGWSDPESFRAGRLPLWAFIVIIVVAVLGAGGAGYYFTVRRRMYD